MENISKNEVSVTQQIPTLHEIEELNSQLRVRFRDKFFTQPDLTRQLVSFQANKLRPAYRLYKYKEAFSAALVEYLLNKYDITAGRLLDPFAGMGTALFMAQEIGLNADGIELLPIGQEIITSRLIIEQEFTHDDYTALADWVSKKYWKESDTRVSLSSIKITDGAYKPETIDAIERYMGTWHRENNRVQSILRFALLSVLESISFTRKDGQYLRWDHRSGRRQGKKPFNKGKILEFDEAISVKIEEILIDIQKGDQSQRIIQAGRDSRIIQLLPGTCLEVLPTLDGTSYEVIITSPPYCNRYDYTRTYALELALLGVSERELIGLRQQMLSCTVENRAKDLLAINPQWDSAIAAADEQELLQAILRYLEYQKSIGELNNSGIPRMVRGYFYEMACVIAECARVMKPGAFMFMVNDNVRYAGASISVDMILSDFAESLGLAVETIMVLPGGKGNSSQQMGEHGRDPLRKCVYVWRKN